MRRAAHGDTEPQGLPLFYHRFSILATLPCMPPLLAVEAAFALHASTAPATDAPPTVIPRERSDVVAHRNPSAATEESLSRILFRGLPGVRQMIASPAVRRAMASERDSSPRSE